MHYILINKKPVLEKNLIKWASHQSVKDRVVIQERFGKDIFISTVFLGIDHNYFVENDPILFETMAKRKGQWRDEQFRYKTWEEAYKGHFKFCKLILNNRKKVKTRHIQIKRSERNV